MNENEFIGIEEFSQEDDSLGLDEIESILESELETQLLDLNVLEEEHEKIGNPESLGNIVKDVVWEQFMNQMAFIAGEDFIKENRGLTLDLRKEAHIQTTDNFAKGKIATHNTEIDFQERYDKWQNSFKRDADGNIIKRVDRRTGNEYNVVTQEAKNFFDDGRKTGSATVHMDHTVSKVEIINDPATNAHLTKDEQWKFANGDINLQPLDSEANKSKGMSPMIAWLKSIRDGKRPAERFNINEEELIERDKKAREEYKKVKDEGEKRSIETGEKSRRQETFRISGKALRAAIMMLLADFVRKIIGKLISWFRSTEKRLIDLTTKFKEAVHDFISDLKKNLINAGGAILTTIMIAIVGPAVGIIKKAWIFIKQGYKSLKEAIDYIKSPSSKSKPLSVLMLEVGKIVIEGLTVGGALVLGEVIEKGLMSIPIFADPIPLLGSLAGILGVFFGAIVSGLIGALALYAIDRMIQKIKKREIANKMGYKKDEIMSTQERLLVVGHLQNERTRQQTSQNIKKRHKQATNMMKTAIEQIKDNGYIDSSESGNDEAIDDITNKLNNL